MKNINGTNQADYLQGSWNDTNRIRGRDGDDTLIGGGQNDRLFGDDGNDLLDGMRGADELTGGAGADTFKIHSWAYSLDVDGERDTITDFSVAEGDKIDLQNVSHYYDSDSNGSIDAVRDLTIADITFEPTSAGNILHVSVWEGDATWDVGIVVLGDSPTASDFLF